MSKVPPKAGRLPYHQGVKKKGMMGKAADCKEAKLRG